MTLLKKENLNPDEVEKVKKVAQELLAKLKTEKFVLGLEAERRNAG